MPNFLNYQKSVADEFRAYELRVRNLIDNANWAEEGRYKEIILMNYLRRILPQNISVGTGFIRSDDFISTQIDIIIYDNTYPLLFSAGDFIITCGESVFAIIEVKTRIEPKDIEGYINKACKNEEKIRETVRCPKLIFNGIFSYEFSGNIKSMCNKLSKVNYLMEPENIYKYTVNHICLGSDYLIKLCGDRINSNKITEPPIYNVYKMDDENSGCAFSLFFSHLLENIYIVQNKFQAGMPNVFGKLLFPIWVDNGYKLVDRIQIK